MIKNLVDITLGMTRSAAFQMWWERFKNHFTLEKYEELPASRMPEARNWYRIASATSKRSMKSKAPGQWQNARIAAIKAAMKSMGRTNADYYPEVASRLRIKKGFQSLKDLTKTDLDRVYNLVLRDQRGGG